ncbi:hypothetical protein FAZ78_03785 [Cereibacter changlensis]|uniref:Uncharacterized protein n=1 Tax=Cereibacter changlensis TaxID=402884 RepID=A0A4U0Z3W8_9RHOB|nr:hypothetical protein [Cereibacter changlensis]TKA97896.1 hypothetical protein FAZ78_03785 [Cereibacter changlensis]
MLEFAYPASTGLPYIRMVVAALEWTAWPLAIVVVAYIFREPMGAIFSKINSISFPGGRADFAQQVLPNTSLEANAADGEIGGIRPFSSIDRNLSPAQIEVRDRVRKEFSELDRGDLVEVLYATVAQERLSRHFAFAYANIYGSQIEALEVLNQRGGVMSVSDAELLFRKLQEEVSQFANVTLEKYLGYLVSFEMVEISSGIVKLTSFGKDFVVWLNALGLPKDRPL